jgi:hypothetical protein
MKSWPCRRGRVTIFLLRYQFWLCFGSLSFHSLSTRLCHILVYAYQDHTDYTTYMKNLCVEVCSPVLSMQWARIPSKIQGQPSRVHDSSWSQFQVNGVLPHLSEIDCIGGCVRISLADFSWTWRYGWWMNEVGALT